MKKPFLAVLGVVGACTACCAIPLAIPLLSGLSVAGLSFIGLDGPSVVSAAVVAAAVTVGIWFKRRRNSACAAPTEGLAERSAICPTSPACACAPVTGSKS